MATLFGFPVHEDPSDESQQPQASVTFGSLERYVGARRRWIGKPEDRPVFDTPCGYACGYVEPYGFVPECGCPVHDPEDAGA